ncbi:MAG: sugar transporter substrate-binding protein [Bryobacterales bacterium]|nr:sugar transporter substrate-binding protein [Bryobacterales bacterium]
MQRQLLLLTHAALLVTVNGCGSTQHEGTEKFVLIANNTKVPYWQAAIAGLNRAGSLMGVKVQVAGPENYDPAVQHERFQKVLQENPAGILVSAGDSKLIRGDIDAAIAKGIPVVTVDSDVEESKRLFFIGTDNYKAGTIGGRILAQQLKGKGNVVFYTMPAQPNLYQRLHGYQDTMAAYPGLKTARVIDTKGQPNIAFDMTKEVLQGGADKVDAFVCLESTSCAEVAEVLDRQHVKEKVVIAMDASPRTLDGIQKGTINATIGQKPFTMCFVGLKMLDDLHHQKLAPLDRKWSEDSFSPIPSFIDTGATLIDKSNVDVFVKALQSSQK